MEPRWEHKAISDPKPSKRANPPASPVKGLSVTNPDSSAYIMHNSDRNELEGHGVDYGQDD